MQGTLFERIGGMPTVVAVAGKLYAKLRDDELVGHFFNDIDLDAQASKMVGFLTLAFDGPDDYRGMNLTAAHAHLVARHGLNEAHFERLVLLLIRSLAEHGVDQGLRSEVFHIVNGMEAAVLGHIPR